MRDGVDVAFAEINEQGGVGGRKLHSSPRTTATSRCAPSPSARKLVEQDKVIALLAVTGTAPSSALLPLVTESKIPMLVPLRLLARADDAAEP